MGAPKITLGKVTRNDDEWITTGLIDSRDAFVDGVKVGYIQGRTDGIPLNPRADYYDWHGPRSLDRTERARSSYESRRTIGEIRKALVEAYTVEWRSFVKAGVTGWVTRRLGHELSVIVREVGDYAWIVYRSAGDRPSAWGYETTEVAAKAAVIHEIEEGRR